MKKLLVSSVCIIFCMVYSFAQKHKFAFYTKEQGIMIILDGNRHGFTKKNGNYSLKVEFNDLTPKHTITLHRLGFEDKVYQYDSKPEGNVTKIFWDMQKEKYKMKEKVKRTFDLAKVRYKIDPGEKVMKLGNSEIYWNMLGPEGKLLNPASAAPVKIFDKNIMEELKICGFEMEEEKEEDAGDNMFDDSEEESETEKKADIAIGAIIKDLKMKGELNPYTRKLYNFSVKMNVQWQFYDNVSKKLLKKVSTTEEIYMPRESSDFAIGVNNAFSENFAAALRDSSLIKAIKSTDSNADKEYKAEVLKKYTISKTKVKKFESYGKMVKDVNPAVVTLIGSEGHGSAFLINDEGYILTNYHVVKGNKGLKAKFQMGFELPVKLLNYDEKADLALLKVQGSGYKALPIATKEYEVGNEVIAIGTPETTSLSNTVTKGIISGKREAKNGIEYIQTDVSISPGNSGGPLINKKGLVVGIVSLKLVGIGTDGIAFAIPISVALEKLNITMN
ncbi:MAG: S1C family serine protease [Bacteroidales bacterium]|nr:S1C family serine protease [Bacteroidales bacterium]